MNDFISIVVVLITVIVAIALIRDEILLRRNLNDFIDDLKRGRSDD